MRSLRKHIPSRTKRWRPRLETLEARQLLSTVWSDFNGDGFNDMAIGVVGEDSSAGAVHIMYGSATGLNTIGTQFWTQDSAGVLDTKEVGDEFGRALASGDFNNDGRADLVIGVPGESIGSTSEVGAVQILMGSATGLTATGNKFFHQDTNRVREVNESGDRFGAALATGDFNGDNFADFAVGTPNEDIGSISDAGTINVFYGSAVGITPTGNQFFHLDLGPMTGDAEDGDEFGASLAAGDFNNDGRDDIAVGIHYKDISGKQHAGAISVIYGSATGLTVNVNQFWHEDVIGMSSLPSQFDHFGEDLTAGDFNGDSRDDLAIGVRDEMVNIAIDAGSFHVLYGTNGGLGINGEQFFNQGDAGGNAESFDFFAEALTAGDFNGDGRSDLAIGASGERVGAVGPDAAGAVNIMYGSASGITTVGAFEIVQEDLGTGDASEEVDLFGGFVFAADFDGNGKDDLAISAVGEDIGSSVLDAGRVFTIYGAASGFTGGQSWGQDTPNIPDVSETGDLFGLGMNSSSGKSAPSGARERQDLAHLITAEVDVESLLTKTNKRRFQNGRR